MIQRLPRCVVGIVFGLDLLQTPKVRPKDVASDDRGSVQTNIRLDVGMYVRYATTRTYLCINQNDYTYIYIYIYQYTHIYIYIYNIQVIPCGTPICGVVSVRVFRSLRAFRILILHGHHCMFVLTSDCAKVTIFEVYLKDILHNLQCLETPTNRKTLQEHQNNLALNKQQ